MIYQVIILATANRKKMGWEITTKFAGVRPEIYAMEIQKDDSEIKRAKRVSI